ncbi:RagB/SusD family nutrient uptake outer membrane protein [Flavitalea sp.]|nr:RagB/SusD family nutrient uptake outer membrane protein [Flavitalea sp.]
MKKYIITQVAVVSLLALLCSCNKDFLDQPVQGALSPSTLANKKGINSLLIGTYAAMDGATTGGAAVGGGGSMWGASPSNFLHGSIAGSEAHKGAGGGSEIPMAPFQRWNSMDAANPYLNLKWKADYEGIARANSVLRILPDVKDMSDAEKLVVEAQAKTLRGHFYFDLKKNFNMVPWIDETATEYAVPNDKDIWPNIVNDFKFGMDNLPVTFGVDIGRVNKWGAATYLGKSYLYQKKWAEAKAIFDQVITQGTTASGLKYDLVANFHDSFDAATENNKESVFVVQMVPNLGTNDVSNSNGGDLLNYPVTIFACCGIYIPSQDLVNSYRTNVSGLPYIDNYNQFQVKSDQGLSSNDPFTPDAGPLDPRLDWTVGRRGIPYLDYGVHEGKAWIRDQAEAGPYSPIKNVHMKATQDKFANYAYWAPGNAINLNLIRFGDVLLLAAEAEAELGNFSKAEEYVNRVRNRAANPAGWVYKYVDNSNPTGPRSNVPAANYNIQPYSTGTFAAQGKPFSLKAIYFERKLELAMEGHRYYDISRWGIAAETMNAYFQYEAPLTTDLVGALFAKNRNEYYPIPQAQIDLTSVDGTPTLKQNPGY